MRRCFARPMAAQSWHELAGIARPRHRTQVAAGRGRNVPAHDPARSVESEADLHRHFRRGRVPHRRWRRRRGSPSTKGCARNTFPIPTQKSATACITSPCTPSRPDMLFMQKHWDVMRSDNAGDLWREVSGNLPTDFGFVIDVHAHEPETIYVVPIKSDSEHYPAGRTSCACTAAARGGNEWEPLTKGLPQQRLLRQRAARRDGRGHTRFLRHLFRHHGRTGVRFARCRRQLDARSCSDLPAVYPVEVQTLP